MLSVLELRGIHVKEKGSIAVNTTKQLKNVRAGGMWDRSGADR